MTACCFVNFNTTLKYIFDGLQVFISQGRKGRLLHTQLDAPQVERSHQYQNTGSADRAKYFINRV